MPTRASATRRCSCSRPHPAKPLDVDAIRDHLESIGESRARRRRRPGAQGPRPQRAAGPGHRLRPGLGTLSRISVENLDNQARDVRETRATAFTGGRRGRGPRPPPTPDSTQRLVGRDAPLEPRPGGRRRRRRRWPRRDLRGVRRRPDRQRRPVGEPEHRRAAARSPASPARARSCCCPTTRTSASPRARPRLR